MRRVCTILVLAALAACGSTDAQVEILDKRALEFLDPDASLEVLGDGFLWTEGPLWVDEGGYLLFSDIPNNVIHKYEPGRGITQYLDRSGSTGFYEDGSGQGSNGLLLDTNGALILFQQGDRRIARMDAPLSVPTGRFESLAERYDGKRFNSPNDGVYRSDGSLYFTDPPYGLANRFLDETREISFQGVFRLSAEGEVELVDEELAAPNGIGLAPDENVLYVAVSDADEPQILAYDLDAAGAASNRRILLDTSEYLLTHPGNPDGMAVHSSGVIFATGPGGVLLVTKDGDVLARVYTGRLAANCTLSGDEQTLYITASDTLMSLSLKGKGGQ